MSKIDSKLYRTTALSFMTNPILKPDGQLVSGLIQSMNVYPFGLFGKLRDIPDSTNKELYFDGQIDNLCEVFIFYSPLNVVRFKPQALGLKDGKIMPFNDYQIIRDSIENIWKKDVNLVHGEEPVPVFPSQIEIMIGAPLCLNA